MRYVAIAFLMMVGAAYSQDIKVVKGDKTSADKYATFELDGVNADDSFITINGRVVNIATHPIEGVRVVITAKTESGEFIGRSDNFTSPSDIGKDEVGFLEIMIRSTGKPPGVLEWSIIQARAM